MIVCEGLADQVFAHVVPVHLQLRIDAHRVPDEFQVAEGHPGLQGVDGDAAVRPEYVVNMQLPDALFRFLLERGGGGGKIRILVSE